LLDGQIQLVVNTPLGRASHEDDAIIRQTALAEDIPCVTTLSGAIAIAEAIAATRRDEWTVRPLQSLGVDPAKG
jgi:carbamoyl-phosphate synthase large subunit